MRKIQSPVVSHDVLVIHAGGDCWRGSGNLLLEDVEKCEDYERWAWEALNTGGPSSFDWQRACRMDGAGCTY